MHMPGAARHDELGRAYFTRAAPRFPCRCCLFGKSPLPEPWPRLMVKISAGANGPPLRQSKQLRFQQILTGNLFQTGIAYGSLNEERAGAIVKISRYVRRIIAGDKVVAGGGMTVRNLVAWLFIALVALFLTKPSPEPRSAFNKPLPLPAELHLE